MNAVACAVALLAVGAAALVWAVVQPVTVLSLAAIAMGTLLVAASAAAAVAAQRYYTLRYEFAPGALIVRSADAKELIRLDEVDGIYAGQRAGSLRRGHGLMWPGYYVGLVRSRSLGPLRVFATTLEADALSIIVAGGRTLVLSPEDPAAFRRELIRRIEAGEELRTRDREPQVRFFGIPGSAVAATVAAALALAVVNLGAISAHYEQLPETVTLRVDPVNRAPEPRPRTDILVIPLLGCAVLGLNLVLALLLRRRERALTVLLCGSACLLETILLLATLRLLP